MDLFGTGQADSSSSDDEPDQQQQPGQAAAAGLVSVIDPTSKGYGTKDGIVFDMLPSSKWINLILLASNYVYLMI